MKCFILFYLLVLCLELSENFFLFPEKKVILLCLKVCPLYCWKRQKRSPDHVYWDHDSSYDWPPVYYEEVDHPQSQHLGYWVYCKHTTTTPKPATTMAPTTTTEEPTWICEVCLKKCGMPNEHLLT